MPFLRQNVHRRDWDSGRRLGDHSREHLRSTRLSDTDLPVGRHFTSPGHSVGDVLVFVIRSGFRSPTERRSFEARMIFRHQMGISTVSEIIKEKPNSFLSPTELEIKYHIKVCPLTFCGITSALKTLWTRQKLNITINASAQEPFVTALMKSKKPIRLTYQKSLEMEAPTFSVKTGLVITVILNVPPKQILLRKWASLTKKIGKSYTWANPTKKTGKSSCEMGKSY